MGMTTTMHARDLSNANYPEFIAWIQDISQACWTVSGKNFKPAFELTENRILRIISYPVRVLDCSSISKVHTISFCIENLTNLNISFICLSVVNVLVCLSSRR